MPYSCPHRYGYDYPCVPMANGRPVAPDTDACAIARAPFAGAACSDAAGAQASQFLSRTRVFHDCICSGPCCGAVARCIVRCISQLCYNPLFLPYSSLTRCGSIQILLKAVTKRRHVQYVWLIHHFGPRTIYMYSTYSKFFTKRQQVDYAWVMQLLRTAINTTAVRRDPTGGPYLNYLNADGTIHQASLRKRTVLLKNLCNVAFIAGMFGYTASAIACPLP